MRPEPNGLDAENINSETPPINAPPNIPNVRPPINTVTEINSTLGTTNKENSNPVAKAQKKDARTNLIITDYLLS